MVIDLIIELSNLSFDIGRETPNFDRARITCWGGNSSKGVRMKVDRMIKMSDKKHNPCPSS